MTLMETLGKWNAKTTRPGCGTGSRIICSGYGAMIVAVVVNGPDPDIFYGCPENTCFLN